VNVVVADFTEFGERGIKDRKVPPDAFVQMALQLAYARTLGKTEVRACDAALASCNSGSGKTEVRARNATLVSCAWNVTLVSCACNVTLVSCACLVCV
jgi:hypothetical protein